MIWLTDILLHCGKFHRLHPQLVDPICRDTPTLGISVLIHSRLPLSYMLAPCYVPHWFASIPAAVPLSQQRSFSSVFGDADAAQLCQTYLPLGSHAVLWTSTVFTWGLLSPIFERISRWNSQNTWLMDKQVFGDISTFQYCSMYAEDGALPRER